MGVVLDRFSSGPSDSIEEFGLKTYNFRRRAQNVDASMDEQKEQPQVAQRVRLLKRILIVLLPLSVLGTYLAVSYSYLLANGPVIIQSYSDPVLASFLIWSFYGLILVLFAYYSRLHKLLATKQLIFVAVIFIIYPVLSYVYILGLWLLNRPRDIKSKETSAETGSDSLVSHGSEN
jgi:hypothetical protein